MELLIDTEPIWKFLHRCCACGIVGTTDCNTGCASGIALWESVFPREQLCCDLQQDCEQLCCDPQQD